MSSGLRFQGIWDFGLGFGLSSESIKQRCFSGFRFYGFYVWGLEWSTSGFRGVMSGV